MLTMMFLIVNQKELCLENIARSVATLFQFCQRFVKEFCHMASNVVMLATDHDTMPFNILHHLFGLIARAVDGRGSYWRLSLIITTHRQTTPRYSTASSILIMPQPRSRSFTLWTVLVTIHQKSQGSRSSVFFQIKSFFQRIKKLFCVHYGGITRTNE